MQAARFPLLFLCAALFGRPASLGGDSLSRRRRWLNSKLFEVTPFFQQGCKPARTGTAPSPRFTAWAAVLWWDRSAFHCRATPIAPTYVCAKCGKLLLQFTCFAAEHAADFVAQLQKVSDRHRSKIHSGHRGAPENQ
jgi:hypothetical protein